jgi:hypothetical protein
MSAKREYENRAIYLYAGLRRLGQPGRQYWAGAVATLDGFVKVYAQDDYASFQFIYGGRSHALTVRKRLTERGLATVARRFVADVVAGAL